MNRGGMRTDLEAGPVTRRELFELVPFDNYVSVVELTGAELEEGFRRAVEGTAHSGLEVSGARIEARIEGPDQRRLVAVHVGDRPLEREARYRVAMNSFMADGGDAYFERREPGRGRTDEPIFIRDLLEDFLLAKGPVKPTDEDRYRIVEP
jgi:2',3'-cyclic-nucleotide 2'-phosphodiesterase (5'-nucleotidase family)